MHIRFDPNRRRTVEVMAIITFDPWLFHADNINLNPQLVGTIKPDRTVTWAAHRTFVLLSRNQWNRLVQFTDGTVAVAQTDMPLHLDMVLAVVETGSGAVAPVAPVAMEDLAVVAP